MRCVASLFLILILLTLSGCEFAPRLGPQETIRTVYVNQNDSQGRPVQVARISENKRVKVELITVRGEIVEDEIDLGGWSVIPPKENAPQ